MRALGIDIGTSTTKVVLVEVERERVRQVAARAAATPTDVPGLLEVVASGCRELAAGWPGIDAIGVASMAETGAPIDAEGAALTELLSWEAGLGADDVGALGAQAPDVFARSGVRLSAKTPLLTWRWLQRKRPETWRQMACWLGAADLVVHALTGDTVTDHTLAGRTGGYRLADPGERPSDRFDGDLLDLADLDPDRLPRVAAVDQVASRLSSSGAARTGLPIGVPVVVAGHDHQVAAWAAGARAPGEVADSLGTAEAVLSVLTKRPDIEPVRQQGMSLVRTVGGDQEALVAGSSSAGAMLVHWLAGVPIDMREQVLAAAAQQAAAERRPTGGAVAPYLRGRQTPEPDPSARPGRPPSGWPPERQARAVIEGICYQARWMIEAQVTGRQPSTVAVIGGDRLPLLWTTLKHETLPWPVAMVRAPEPVAAGAAVLALARSGALGDPQTALAQAPTLPTATEPPPGEDRHAHAYGDFLERVRAATESPDGQACPDPAARRPTRLP